MYYLVSYVTPGWVSYARLVQLAPVALIWRRLEKQLQKSIHTEWCFGVSTGRGSSSRCVISSLTQTPLNKYPDRQLFQEMSDYTFSLWNTTTHWHNCVFHPASAFSWSDRSRLQQSCTCTFKCNRMFAIVVVMKCFDCSKSSLFIAYWIPLFEEKSNAKHACNGSYNQWNQATTTH